MGKEKPPVVAQTGQKQKQTVETVYPEKRDDC